MSSRPFQISSASYNAQNRVFQFTILHNKNPVVFPPLLRGKSTLEHCFHRSGDVMPDRTVPCVSANQFPKVKNAMNGKLTLTLSYNNADTVITMSSEGRTLHTMADGRHKTHSMDVKNIIFKSDS